MYTGGISFWPHSCNPLSEHTIISVLSNFLNLGRLYVQDDCIHLCGGGCPGGAHCDVHGGTALLTICE